MKNHLVGSIFRSQWVDQFDAESYGTYKSHLFLLIAGYKIPVIENLGATLVCTYVEVTKEKHGLLHMPNMPSIQIFVTL